MNDLGRRQRIEEEIYSLQCSLGMCIDLEFSQGIEDIKEAIAQKRQELASLEDEQ